MGTLTLVSAASLTLLAFVFTQAAWHKLADFAAFSGYLADYRILPDVLVKPAALLLVGAEGLVVVGLLIPVGRSLAACGTILLLALYAAAMTVNLIRGRSGVACGCGGAVQPISPALLVRNALLALAALTVVLQPVLALELGVASASFAIGFLAWVLLGAAEQIVANSVVAQRLRQIQ